MHNAAKGKGLRINSVSISCFVFIVVVMLLSCPPGWAGDDKKAKKSTDIGDITVTSTKMATEVDKIPTNIIVIPREEIEKYPGHSNAISLLRDLNLPGMYFTGTDTNDFASLRFFLSAVRQDDSA